MLFNIYPWEILLQTISYICSSQWEKSTGWLNYVTECRTKLLVTPNLIRLRSTVPENSVNLFCLCRCLFDIYSMRQQCYEKFSFYILVNQRLQTVMVQVRCWFSAVSVPPSFIYFTVLSVRDLCQALVQFLFPMHIACRLCLRKETNDFNALLI